MNAIISGDVVASTALSETELQQLASDVEQLFNQLNQKYNNKNILFWGRLIKGDYIECYMQEPKYSLRIALLIKTLVKKMILENLEDKTNQKKRELFKKYGIRLAIGIGSMRTVDKVRGILDGEAIYLSGRKIDDQRSSHKEKVVIKNTLFFETTDSTIKEQGSVIVELLDVILNNSTARQCNVIYHKLIGLSELEIAQKLDIKQAAVNQHSTAIGWNAIEHTLNYFEQLKF
jgi:hypothetical protein